MEGARATFVEPNILAIVSFAAYLVLVSGIGFYTARFSSQGMKEFFLAGRKLNRFVVALSAVASGRSSWLLLGVTGTAYVRGVSALWTVVGYIIVELFLFLFLAKRLRRYTARLDNLTIPDFFESRFNDVSGLLRSVAVAIIIIFMVAYVSAQFAAGGKAVNASFNLNYHWGIFLTALIVLIYTLMGGFLAVSLTDVVQAFFMIVALVLLPVVAISHYGGINLVLNTLKSLDPRLIDPFSLTAGILIGYLGIGLGSPGNPHILVRYMAIDDPKQLRLSALVGTGWNVIMAWGAIYIGLAGRAFYHDLSHLPGSDRENLFPFLAQMQLHPVLFGLVVASIFAAIMSTADSQLLVAASCVVRDFYQKVLKKGVEFTQKRLVLLSRIVTLVLVILSLLLAILASDLVFWLVLFAWSGLGAAIGPTIILSLYWKRTTKWGVIAGLLAGTSITIIWNKIPALKNIVYELVPAFLIATLVTILVSLLTTAPEQAEKELAEISTKYRQNRRSKANSSKK